MSAAASVYERLPPSLQNGAVTAYGYWWRHKRRGGRFPLFVSEFLDRESWHEDRWRAWQKQRFRELISIAAEAPGYQQSWHDAGISRAVALDMTLADLRAIPILTKKDLQAQPQAYCPGGRPPRRAFAWQTSGSTGTPVTIYYTDDDLRRGLALREARYSSYAGVSHDMPRATFAGRLVSDRGGRPPHHRYNHAERQLYFSAYQLSTRTIQDYVAALYRYRPAWITGYASTISELVRLSTGLGLELPSMVAVITTSEPVPPSLRKGARELLGCRVYEEYGLAEETCFALECEFGSMHVSPDAGFVELLDENDEPCAPGEVGEIIATGFLKEAQPLIRYRTGDTASWSPVPCKCGRLQPVLASIEGRVDDVVFAPDGRRVSRLTAVARGLPNIAFMQFIQTSPEAIDVRVVAETPLDEALKLEITKRLHARLGLDMAVRVYQADHPIRTPRGKVRAVIREPAGSN